MHRLRRCGPSAVATITVATSSSNLSDKSLDQPRRRHDINVNVNEEFTVTLHEQVRYRGSLQY